MNEVSVALRCEYWKHALCIWSACTPLAKPIPNLFFCFRHQTWRFQCRSRRGRITIYFTLGWANTSRSRWLRTLGSLSSMRSRLPPAAWLKMTMVWAHEWHSMRLKRRSSRAAESFVTVNILRWPKRKVRWTWYCKHIAGNTNGLSIMERQILDAFFENVFSAGKLPPLFSFCMSNCDSSDVDLCSCALNRSHLQLSHLSHDPL